MPPARRQRSESPGDSRLLAEYEAMAAGLLNGRRPRHRRARGLGTGSRCARAARLLLDCGAAADGTRRRRETRERRPGPALVVVPGFNASMVSVEQAESR